MILAEWRQGYERLPRIIWLPIEKNLSKKLKEASIEFRTSRQRHPGIESAINALQTGNGLKRCRDRSELGLERYLGLAILGRNLHALGKLLIARQNGDSNAAISKRIAA